MHRERKYSLGTWCILFSTVLLAGNINFYTQQQTKCEEKPHASGYTGQRSLSAWRFDAGKIIKIEICSLFALLRPV